MAIKLNFKGSEINYLLEFLNDYKDNIFKIPNIEDNLETISINKVDKIEGKGLSTEDFTSALKEKLEALKEYDDSKLNTAITSLRNDLNTLVSGNTSTAIENFNEVIAFLNDLEDTRNLSGIIANIEKQIASKQDRIEDLPELIEDLREGVSSISNSVGELDNNIIKLQKEKQDVIKDLDTIKSGSKKGETSIQKIKIGNDTYEPNVDGIVSIENITGEVYVFEYSYEDLIEKYNNQEDIVVSTDFINAIKNNKAIAIKKSYSITLNTSFILDSVSFKFVNGRYQIVFSIPLELGNIAHIILVSVSVTNFLTMGINITNTKLSTINGNNITESDNISVVNQIKIGENIYTPKENGEIEINNNVIQSDWYNSDSSSIAYINNKTHFFRPSAPIEYLVVDNSTIGTNIHEVGEYFRLGNSVYKSVNIVGTQFNCQSSGVDVIVVVVSDINSDGSISYYLRHIRGNSNAGLPIVFCGRGSIKPIDDVYVPETIARVKDISHRNVGAVDPAGEVDDTITFATMEYVNTAIANAITTTLNTPV